MSNRARSLSFSSFSATSGGALLAMAAFGAVVWACGGTTVDGGPGATTPVADAAGGGSNADVTTISVPTTGDDGGTTTFDATTPPQPQDDASTAKDAGSSFGGDASGITCGTSVCNTPDLCCVTGLDAGGTASCAASCAPGGYALACDGPEDCSGGGNLCCATLNAGAGSLPNCPITSASTTCAATCKTNINFTCPAVNTVRLCHATADCAGEPTGATSCCAFEQGGQTVTFCAGSPISAFGKCL